VHGPGSPSRRGVVLAGGVLLLTACDLDPRSDPPAEPTPTSGAPADPSAEADLALLDEARELVVAALAAVTSVRRAVPALRAALGPLRRLHAAHLETLDEAGPASDGGPGASLPAVGDAAGALTGLRRDELRLQRRLAAMAVPAASGPFARMLASMSAGVAAHLAALPEQP
jgi:hypothetical protein